MLEDPMDAEHQPEARLLLGQVYESLDFSDRALETYLPLVESQTDPRYPGQAAFRIGRLLLELGQAQRAYPFFVEAGNDNDLALVESLPYYRGRALVEMGRSGEGIRELEGYLNGLPADLTREIQAYLAIAKGYLQQGDRAAALRVLARANTLAEGTPFADTVRNLRMRLVDTVVGDDLPPSAPPTTTGSPPPARVEDAAPRAPLPASP
jgi:tetratricopeptide (TPR) repeat protein